LITSGNNLPLFPVNKTLLRIDPFFHESMARKAGYGLIAGVDEAGRGSLAGPVVAAAVIFPEKITLKGIKDSKEMTEKAREQAFSVINQKALAISIGVVSPKFIDGIHAIPVFLPQKCLKKGDRISLLISAASVMAKVYRDRIMRSYHERFPGYGFFNNKGYGTARHIEGIKLHGASPIHRLTFKGVS
jgi:ribonuclease HII